MRPPNKTPALAPETWEYYFYFGHYMAPLVAYN